MDFEPPRAAGTQDSSCGRAPRPRRRAAAGLVLAGTLGLFASQACALNIVLCNDDSIAAANIRALKKTLQAKGHDVIVSAPADNGSGTGGALAFLRPIGPLTSTMRAVTALGIPAGSAGVGTDPNEADVNYVNGSPVAACLYGLDVAAPRKWGGSPDLVISGPNEAGSNVGAINWSSGTFNNMIYAIGRQLPVFAISDAKPGTVNWSPALPQTAHAYVVADVAARLVDALIAHKQDAGGRLMPVGVGLNVNVPNVDDSAIGSLAFKWTRLGTSSDFMPAFFEDLSKSTYGKLLGLSGAGIAVEPGGTTLPSGVVMPKDAAPDSESNVISAKSAISVTPVQQMPEARRVFSDAMRIKLDGFVR